MSQKDNWVNQSTSDLMSNLLSNNSNSQQQQQQINNNNGNNFIRNASTNINFFMNEEWPKQNTASLLDPLSRGTSFSSLLLKSPTVLNSVLDPNNQQPQQFSNLLGGQTTTTTSTSPTTTTTPVTLEYQQQQEQQVLQHQQQMQQLQQLHQAQQAQLQAQQQTQMSHLAAVASPHTSTPPSPMTTTSTISSKQQQQSYNPYSALTNTPMIVNTTTNTINANTYDDDGDEEVKTPPTPPISDSNINWDSPTYRQNTTSFTADNGINHNMVSQFGLYNPTVTTTTTTTTATNITSAPTSLSALMRNEVGTYNSPTMSNEYESPAKFQRIGTYSEETLNDRLRSDPHFSISFLQEQTSKLRQSSSQQSSQDDLTRNRSFIMTHYETGCIPISTDYYNSLLTRYNTRPDYFERAKEKQIQVISNNDLTLAADLQTIYTSMKKDIDEENNELKNLLTIRILEPYDLRKIRECLEGLKSHLRIVDVLYNELKYIINKKKPECCAALIITQQPYSQVIFRGGKGMNENFKVQMIFGVLQPDNISPVYATINKSVESVTGPGKKEKVAADKSGNASTPTVENGESNLNTQSWEAEFKNIKINVSTRMTPSSLKFVATYKEKTSGKTIEKDVESVPSSPLIVITNESQWSEAAGKLLMSDAFAHRDEITWEMFANILHSHILTATHQTTEIKRKLHSWEFEYIQKNYFDGKTSISKSECKSFWDRFGPILQTIHFKRHIEPLWYNGSIYGLITKAECNSYLMTLPEGSFLIRFSDSSPGSFAVAYVTNDENDRVKHYLVKPDDIGANKSLADFLRSRHQFKTLYQVDPSKRSLHPKVKDVEFEQYYSKRLITQQQTNPGYVSL